MSERGVIVCLGTSATLARTMRFGRLTLDAVNRTDRVHEYAAGKAVNVARCLKTMGARPLCLGIVGGDRGRAMTRDLDEAFIAYDFVHSHSPTRLCVTVIDDETASSTELVEESHALPAHEPEQLLSNLHRVMEEQDVQAIVLSGSLAPGMDTSYYARCVDLAHESGVVCVVDATGRPLIEALEAGAGIIKVNERELCMSFGIEVETDEDLAVCVKKLAEASGAWVIVTRGAEATIASDGKRTMRAAGETAAVVSAIGSGDCFTAGVALEIAEGGDLPRALVLGTAAAGANVESPHAAHVDPMRIKKLCERVRISEWSI